jgi:hypothetical protein
MVRVPYVFVAGDDEVASKKMTVTVRKKSQPNKLFKEAVPSRPARIIYSNPNSQEMEEMIECENKYNTSTQNEEHCSPE